MNVTELLQEETTYEIGRALNTRLRELGALLEVTWGEMPGFVKNGAWYGGAIGPRGGRKGENGQLLPFDRRYPAFFRELAKELTRLHGEGHVISVAPNSVKNGKVVPLSPDQILGELKKAQLKTSDHSSPCVRCRWYISFNEVQTASSQFIRLAGYVRGDFADLYYDVAFTVGEQLKQVKSKLNSISKDRVRASRFVGDLLPLWHEAGGALPTNNHHAKVLDLAGYRKAANEPGWRIAGKLDSKVQSGTLAIKGGVMSKLTQKIDTARVLKLIDRWAP